MASGCATGGNKDLDMKRTVMERTNSHGELYMRRAVTGSWMWDGDGELEVNVGRLFPAKICTAMRCFFHFDLTLCGSVIIIECTE